MYSFGVDGNCPHCGKTMSSVIANGHKAIVNDDGVLEESETSNTTLILSDYNPTIQCGYCKGEIDFVTMPE